MSIVHVVTMAAMITGPEAGAEERAFASPPPAVVPAIQPRMQVVITPAQIDGDLAPPDREALAAALRRGLVSSTYTLMPEDPTCSGRSCRERDAQRHRVELHLRAASRSYQVELRAYRPGATEPFAIANGHCDICGIAELEHLVASKADALRQRFDDSELAPAIVAVSSEPEGAAVRIDGVQVGVTPFLGEVAPGAHRVEIAHAGYYTDRRRVTASRGVRERVHSSLVRSTGRPGRTAVGAVALGAGIASLGGGIALLALDGREVARRCDDGARDAEGDCRWIHRTQAGGIVLAVLGTTLAATGATLLILERRKPRGYAMRATLSPQRVALTLSF